MKCPWLLAILLVGLCVVPMGDADDRLYFQSVELVATTQIFQVELRKSSDEDLAGLDFDVCVDGELAVFTSWSLGLELRSVNDHDGPDVLLVEETDDGLSVEIVIDEVGREVLGSGFGRLLRLNTEALGEDGDVIEISYCGDPLFEDSDENEVEPILDDLSIDVVDGPIFIRGDVDGSGVYSLIIDVLFLLNWAFKGGEEPTCMNAADLDGNRIVQPLVDALRGLGLSFSDQAPLPRPWPLCGADPEPDPLDCDEETCTP